jgi:uncharacterized spore protein YtfJ
MPNSLRSSLLVALLALPGLSLQAQTPLGKPLAEFDKLASQLTSAAVVGEPLRAGDATVIPFAAVRFGVGSLGGGPAVGGGMGGRVVPLGVLIIQGDEVRLEQIPDVAQEPSPLHELVKGILDRKVVFMGNGLNIGSAPGNVSDLESLIKAQMGQTTIMGNSLNLGSLTAPRPASATPAASLAELKRLFDSRKYPAALTLVNTLLAKDAKNADLIAWKLRILEAMSPGTASQ